MKKTLLAGMALSLALALLSGCGAEKSEPAADPQDTSTPAAGAEQAQPIQAGTWLAYDGEAYTYYFFDADGASGSTLRQADGTGVGFTYEVQGSDVTFYMGSPDTPVSGTLAVQDGEHLTLQWKENAAEELTYLSADTAETFLFYSDEELCGMALQYCRDHADAADDLSNLMAAAAVNEDGTVAIQLYENLGDHNSTYAWYTVDRQSAAGTDDTTGAAIDLKA